MSPTAPRPQPGPAGWALLGVAVALLATRLVPPQWIVLQYGEAAAIVASALPFVGLTLVWAFVAEPARRAGEPLWVWGVAALGAAALIHLLAAARVPPLNGFVSQEAHYVFTTGVFALWGVGAALATYATGKALGPSAVRGLTPWLATFAVLTAVAHPFTVYLLGTSVGQAEGLYGNALTALTALPLLLALTVLLVMHARLGSPHTGLAIGAGVAAAFGVMWLVRAVALLPVADASVTQAAIARAYAVSQWGLAATSLALVLAALALTWRPQATPDAGPVPEATAQRL